LEPQLDTQTSHKTGMVKFIGVENKELLPADHSKQHCATYHCHVHMKKVEYLVILIYRIKTSGGLFPAEALLTCNKQMGYTDNNNYT